MIGTKAPSASTCGIGTTSSHPGRCEYGIYEDKGELKDDMTSVVFFSVYYVFRVG